MRSTIRETDEKLLQLQTYTKSYIEKILENYDDMSATITRFSSETHASIGQLESGVSKFEKYALELNEKLYQAATKHELEQLTRRTE